MSKRKIFLLTIIVLIILLNVVMFGFVFRLRNQTVIVVGEDVKYSSQQIILAGELENGRSIFLIDKDHTIQSIESKFSDLKVIQIKTTGINSIEIKVRARHKTYFVKQGLTYYVLDEDLKVLEKVDNHTIVESLNLIEIESEVENISSSTDKCDFIGNSTQKQLFYNLYVAVHTNTTISKTEPTATESHLKMCELIKSVSIQETGAKDGSVDTILNITTETGIKLKIHGANVDLANKFNASYTLISDSAIVEDNTVGTLELYGISDAGVIYELHN